MSNNRGRLLPVLAIGLTLALGILIGTLVSWRVRAARIPHVAPGAAPLTMPSPAKLSESFARVAEAIEPTVVNINTESSINIPHRPFNLPKGSPFEDFFDKFFQDGGPNGPPHHFEQQSLGSGIILDKAGYILTNYHVIMQPDQDKPVDRIKVFLHSDDATKYKAKIIGADKWTDLAVIKINAGKSLPAAHLGDSDSMRVGDWVLAVGSPFGLESTVTAGILSAKGRDIEGGTSGEFKRFLQTDAAINPGNSGGPLVNLAGQVIGVNTAIATRHGAYDGVGFAIPSNTARKIYNSLIQTGTVRRGAIGVTFTAQRNPALLRSFGARHGVVIQSVSAGGPADRAGLKMGDVILAVDGKPIMDGDQLVSVISETPIGQKVNIEFLRNGKRMEAKVQVADRNKIISEMRHPQEKGGGEHPSEQASGVLGLAVRNLTREQAQDLMEQLHLGQKEGVLVTDVDPTGFGSDLTVQRGDVILSINHKLVTSVDDFSRLQAQLKSGMDVLILVARSSGRRFQTYFFADRLP